MIHADTVEHLAGRQQAKQSAIEQVNAEIVYAAIEMNGKLNKFTSLSGRISASASTFQSVCAFAVDIEKLSGRYSSVNGRLEFYKPQHNIFIFLLNKQTNLKLHWNTDIKLTEL